MTEAETSPWDAFPLVMCINLRTRDDRYREVRDELARVGLGRVIFYRTEPQDDREKGCIDSHMACLDYAVSRGVPYALIFEDDVLFQEGHLESMKRIVEFLDQHPECPFLHLGGFIFRKVEKIGKHFLRGGIMTTHAYIIRAGHARKLLSERSRFSGMSVDTFFTIINRNRACVHINPLAAIQRASTSDGTWDSRNLGETGWLSKAMIYSALPYRDRLRYDGLPKMELFKIEQGLTFFRVYRHVMRLKTNLANRRSRSSNSTASVSDWGRDGEYFDVNLSTGESSTIHRP